jgi:hypothetical protein
MDDCPISFKRSTARPDCVLLDDRINEHRPCCRIDFSFSDRSLDQEPTRRLNFPWTWQSKLFSLVGDPRAKRIGMFGDMLNL